MPVARRRYRIKGIVQGVGFRPFVYNLAKRMGLSGWVLNDQEGVVIEAQGELSSLVIFAESLQSERPKNASILEIAEDAIPIMPESGFVIRKSEHGSAPKTFILPDLAPCQDCLKEMLDPQNRRFRYPFTNCTNCGPRFSIILDLPYDRANTTMRSFPMCNECRGEYEDPRDRRFHAQPNACSVCGPELFLLDSKGGVMAKGDDALNMACGLILEGSILAVKGVGGFQLMADANHKMSVQLLRKRKSREEKPFALMYPTLERILEDCYASDLEQELLISREAPIVILKARGSGFEWISPGNPHLGAMLPSSPLHHLMLSELNCPVVATSGNRSDEPICTDEKEALEDLSGIADYFLAHNRPIAERIDDSLVRVVCASRQMLRRARGFASLPLLISRRLSPSVAFGGQMKNTVAAARENMIFISPHIGDLENQKAYQTFAETLHKMTEFYEIEPKFGVADCHPDYQSTRYALGLKLPIAHCQHHMAHVFSCMAENDVEPPLLGISWDGTGYGEDETVWGGEFFTVEKDFSYRRFATFKPFPLPGGAKAIREPRFSAIGALFAVYGDRLFERRELCPLANLTEREVCNLKRVLSAGLNAPKCSSVGRLFDAVSSLIGNRQQASFEGQAAMELEFLALEDSALSAYPFEIKKEEGGPLVIEWEAMIVELLGDLERLAPSEIAVKFHRFLVQALIEIAKRSGRKKVLLSGGVFQNKILTEITVEELVKEGFEPYWHKDVPPNDGGLAVGQLYSRATLANEPG